MYKTLLKFYKNGLITIADLDKAVDKFHWITKEEELKIIGSVADDKIN